MRPKVKICGITNLIDAKNALNLGADFIGFINIEYSPRFLKINEIEEISRELSDSERSKSVLLTQEESIDGIVSSCAKAGFKIIQPYANISSSDLNKLRSLGYKIFKPLRVASYESLDEIEAYQNAADLVILDTKSNDPELLGGSGKVFDWEIFNKAKDDYPLDFALAGGLSAENISEAIRVTQPYMVDLSSGVESKPGIKSLTKLKDLFNAINNFAVN